MTPSFRLWRSSVTIEELTTTVARYLGEERTSSAFESFAASRRISLDPRQEADIQLLRYAEHILASAIGAASSRLVLSLLLRKRTVSTKAALKLLDDANAAIQYNREILQTALDHVRQGIAVFDKELQLVCWNRQFGELLDLPPSLDPRRHRARRDPAPQRRARRARARPGRGPRARPHPALRLGRRADPRALHRARAGDRDPRQPHAGRRPRHHRDRRDAERGGRRGARTRQRKPRTARARAHQGADPAQRRARARQGRGRRGEHLQDALPRRREPRHPAAAQRGAALRHQPGRAAGQRRGRAARLERRCLARSRGGDPRRAARHLAARFRRDEAGDFQLPHRRDDAPARGRVRAARAREGARR